MISKKILILSFLIVVFLASCTPSEECTPRGCCKALTAECLSCFECTTVEEYCKKNPETSGCPELEKTELEILTEDCEEKGGTPIGCEAPLGIYCSMPTSDGGKRCKNSLECQAECVAPENCPVGKQVTGKCAERTGLICSGVQTVNNGKCGPFGIA